MTVFFLTLIIPTMLFAQGGKNYGEFAPPDAYIDSSGHAFYGSENEWSRRMFSERAADRFYKRRGQRQLLAILDGRPGEAVKLCQKRLQADPDDLESLFVLTIAWCQLQQPERAFAAMQETMARGLSFERFLAGPRELLLPLYGFAKFKDFTRTHPGQLLHGPMLGAMTDHRVRFWLRTREEVPLQVRVFEPGAASDTLTSPLVSTRAARDYTAVVEISGLRPATAYGYEVRAGSEIAFRTNRPMLRTFPPAGRPARFQVGFGGGAGYTPVHERMWDTVASHQPAAFLLLGDNVYVDLPETPGAFHQYTFYRRQSRPEFRRLVQSTPIYAIWDDHDAAIDDVWLGPFLDRPDWKLPMLEFFRINWNNPAYGDEEWPGCWFQFSIADVDFFMLDGRFYRTNPFADNPTMLGPVQKRWLLQELKISGATFKVIVSPVPWSSGAKPGSRDTWDGFSAEREEIFTFIEKNRISGVILLSADRHRSEAWKIERPGGYPLYEFSSSKLTNLHTHEIVPGPLFSYNEKCSFGLLTFDTTRDDPEVTFKIISIDNEIIHILKVKRSEIDF